MKSDRFNSLGLDIPVKKHLRILLKLNGPFLKPIHHPVQKPAVVWRLFVVDLQLEQWLQKPALSATSSRIGNFC